MMGNLLRRELAPIDAPAWEQIDAEAERIFKHRLTGRRLVDFRGPGGWELAAVNLGQLSIPENQRIEGVHWGVRNVLPIIEVRAPFTLSQMQIDRVARGAADMNLDPVVKAAEHLAAFEETIIYHGYVEPPVVSMIGISAASAHKPVEVQLDADGVVAAVEQGMAALDRASIGGPYHWVVGPEVYFLLTKPGPHGSRLRKHVVQELGGGVHLSAAVRGGVIFSGRGGDFELTVGQDIAIGYAIHDRDNVELYLTESLAFRVLEPKAAVRIDISGG